MHQALIARKTDSGYAVALETLDDLGSGDVVVDIASNGKLESQSKNKNFDSSAAFERCVWFRSESQ